MLHSFRRRISRTVVIVALVVAALTVSVSAASAGNRVVYRPPVVGVFQLTGADLVVSSTSQGYDQYGGYYTDAVISNQGNQPAGSFYVSNGGAYLPVAGLSVGASTLVRFYRAGYCETGGTVMADAFNQVYEVNEGNNSQAWSIIC
jgi:hypothetical protein